MFTHLHVHSYYSLLCGASSPEDLCLRAKELGMSGLALTDTNSLAGALVFAQACAEQQLRPIFGVQITASLPAIWGEPYVLVLAKDAIGYSEICRLTSARQLNEKFNLVAAAQNATAHVAVIASSLALAQAIANKAKSRVMVEIFDWGTRPDLGRIGLTVQQAAAAGLGCVITHPSYFSRPEDYPVHRALRATQEHTSLAGLAAQAAAPAAAHLQNQSEMAKRFGSWPAVWERTQRVADECQGKPPRGAFHFPAYPCPEGESEFEYLSRICISGLRRRFQPSTPRVLKHLANELEVIENKHFSGYFLAVWDIAREAARRGIPTVGRGSAANSLVSYCLGITHVDPVKHGLFFERFLNPEREDPPDIDLDFPWDQRDEMLAYAYQRFGEERVAMICTTMRLHGRSAVREAGRLLGLTEREISNFAQQLPHWGRVQDIVAAKKKLPESQYLPLAEEPWKSVLFLAERLESIPRHMSVHPGGMVIAPGKISDAMPLELATKGVVVTQYDMYSVEDSGFVKIDLLGQRGLAVIRDAGKAAGLDWNQVDPYADEPTKKLLREGATMGCFYVESPAMRLLLRKLKCDDFELLTAASSIIRPGVSNSGMMRMFVERHLGRQPVKYAHPALRPILRDTYGVMVYQEDVIKVVHAVAGMTLGEADKLRRCMSKKRHWEKIATYRQRFGEGARSRGVSEAAIQEIWRQIESFGGYAFCKAHSASYAQLSFQSAYLKAHHPAEFMAAVLSNQGGFYSAPAYWEEARRLGLALKPLDVNASFWRYTAEGNSLRMGFLALKGFPAEAAQGIVHARQSGGKFENLRDLQDRAGLLPDKIALLIQANACADLQQNTTQLAWECTRLRQQANPRELELPLNDTSPIPGLTATTAEERWQNEIALLPGSVQAHPLMQYRQELSALAGPGTVAAMDLIHYAGQRVRVYGWLVTWRRSCVHKSGEPMKFMTLEDFTNTFEVTLFPKVYRKYGNCLLGKGPYVIEGVVENDRGGITITAEIIRNLRVSQETGSDEG